MAEKVLRNRKRRPASKGRLIRISDAVSAALQRTRANNRLISWDACLREVLGLPNRRGIQQHLLEGYLEVNTGRMYFDPAEARGAAVVAAAKQRTKKYKAPIKMRELP